MFSCVLKNYYVTLHSRKQKENCKMNKQDLKKEIISQLIELKMQAQMDEQLFHLCAGPGFNPKEIDQILDNANDIRRRIAALEELLSELEKK